MISKYIDRIAIIAMPLVVFCVGLNKVDFASNVVHVLFGTTLLLVCLAKTIRLSRTAKYWAIIPFAFLMRQFLFVIVPIAVTPHVSDFYHVGSWFFDDLFEGGLIISIENYSMFLVLYLYLRDCVPKPSKVDEDRGRFFLFCAGIALLCVGIATRIAFYGGHLSFLGRSLTGQWFTLGMALSLSVYMGTRLRDRVSYPKVAFATGLLCALALPLAGTGSRGLVLVPFSCLVGVYLCFRMEHLRVYRMTACFIIAFVLLAAVFSMMAGVRAMYYMGGEVASIEQMRDTISVDIGEGLEIAMVRMGSSTSSAQIVAESPDLFPQAKVSRVASLFAGSLMSRNILDIEQLLGTSYSVDGVSPAEHMASSIGFFGGASFPLSCDLYLIGGYGGVALGGVLAGVMVVFLVICLRKVLKNKVVLIALLSGVMFPGFAFMETAPALASLLLWNMWTLVFLCFLLQEGANIVTFKRRKRPPHVVGNRMSGRFV